MRQSLPPLRDIARGDPPRSGDGSIDLEGAGCGDKARDDVPSGGGCLDAVTVTATGEAGRTPPITDDVEVGTTAGMLDTNGHDLSVSGTVKGDSKLVKAGAGTRVLSGQNVHLGGTDVLGGTLEIATAGALGTGTDADYTTQVRENASAHQVIAGFRLAW